jgi:Asp-tRNA(Asn)/Glu-tRNA(Gln) amidotransferase A subunit family amidase
MGHFTNRPVNSLTDVHFEVRDRGIHAVLDRLEGCLAAHESALRLLALEDGRFGRLRREADALIATFPRPRLRPYLFGVPIVVEEGLQLEHLPAGAARCPPPAALPRAEAEIVTRLRTRGALILGRAACAELAHLAPGPRSAAPPADALSHGSRQGCTAAVAARLCPLAVAVETAGAVVASAADHGVVAFKPSHGHISNQGVIPLAPSLDQCATLTVDVESASVAVNILCDKWLFAAPVRRPVLAIPEGTYLGLATAERLAHFRDTCDWLSGRYRVRSVSALSGFDTVRARHDRLLAAEAASTQVARLRASDEVPSQAPGLADLVTLGQEVSARQLREDRSGRTRLRAQLTALMDRHRIDLWLSPASAGVTLRTFSPTDRQVMGIPWTYAGLPTLSVPAGRDAAGLPVGLQIAGRWGDDAELLAWALEIGRVAAL